MRPVCWLHISDFHMNNNETGPQRAVLKAMVEDIKGRRHGGLHFDFVLVTGDLAFSGKASEYELVGKFFEELSSAVDLPREKIFCVPGNHDVERSRQKMCFAGARNRIRNQSDVYSFLQDAEERQTLLLRLRNFHEFQESFFSDQKRVPTDDQLGYVSFIEVDEFSIAIMGLNSAWLAEGGPSDHGQLVLGEQQINNSIEIVNRGNPQIVIGMEHHPFDLLKDFDRSAVKHRVESACDFFHFGHLHTPDAHTVTSHAGHCLTLAAGASFESRESHNAYTVILFDPLNGQTDVTFVRYDPNRGVFAQTSKETHPHEIVSDNLCSVAELADALDKYCPDSTRLSYYLSGLLLDATSEVPIRAIDSVHFGAITILKELDPELSISTDNFFAVRRAIKLLYGHKPLPAILASHGAPIESYVRTLKKLCVTDASLESQLLQRNSDARSLAGAHPGGQFRYTLDSLDELLAAAEWDVLRERAEQASVLDDQAASSKGKRMLALCLANSTERGERERAVNLFRELALSEAGGPEDWAHLATLLRDDGKHSQAKCTVIGAIETFPQSVLPFVEIGMTIVELTGDLEFRRRLLAHKYNRRHHGGSQ